MVLYGGTLTSYGVEVMARTLYLMSDEHLHLIVAPKYE